jgi:hypothetical protein
MAILNSQQASALAQQLETLLQSANPSTEQIAALVNQILGGTTAAGALTTSTSQITAGVYKRFNPTFDLVDQPEIVTTGLWSGGAGSLTNFFTSSVQVNQQSGLYYWNVYQENPSGSDTAEIQFALAYGNRFGEGSVSRDIDDDALFPTLATYGQYRTLLLENTGSIFQFLSSTLGTTTGSNDIYVINFARSRYREKVDAGNIEFNLSGSNGLFTFIDDSGKKFGDSLGRTGRIFNIVSGSLNLGTSSEPTIVEPTGLNGAGFGLFYPDQGIVILNPSAIHSVIGNTFNALNVVAGVDYGTDADKQNQALLFNALRLGGDFEARRTETISTKHYFVRATNQEFNFSNNPTYLNEDGTFAEPAFIGDPKVFITTVGLYNDNNELLAVGKVSQPIAKDFGKEVLIKVRLDF